MLHDFLIQYVRTKQNKKVKATLGTLLEQLKSRADLQLSHTLPYYNPVTEPKNRIDRLILQHGIVTIAHVLPAENQVVIASGFGIHHGELIVTCAHPFYQAGAILSKNNVANDQSQSLIITHQGELVSVEAIKTHLVLSDLVLLTLDEGKKVNPLPIDPFPPPISTSLISYEFISASILDKTTPMVSADWKSANVLYYRDQNGHEAESGTYDQLSCLLYSHMPTLGSSGGPILNKDTNTVVGIIRGNEMNYSLRKQIGFATPSECLFEAFQLPGMSNE